jgi:hypothetical protein
MSHKQSCICECREHLQSRNLTHVFNQKEFESTYKKFKGSQGNAFTIGLRAADEMIKSYKPAPAGLEQYTQFFDLENLQP